jgi:hypothetical protein
MEAVEKFAEAEGITFSQAQDLLDLAKGEIEEEQAEEPTLTLSNYDDDEHQPHDTPDPQFKDTPQFEGGITFFGCRGNGGGRGMSDR